MKPIPILIEYGPEKLNGFILKMTPVGMLIEMTNIPFKVGTIILTQFSLETQDTGPLLQSVRTIKHYENFRRQAPKRKSVLARRADEEAGRPSEEPAKKLIEVHFLGLKDTNKLAVDKFLKILEARLRNGEG